MLQYYHWINVWNPERLNGFFSVSPAPHATHVYYEGDVPIHAIYGKGWLWWRTWMTSSEEARFRDTVIVPLLACIHGSPTAIRLDWFAKELTNKKAERGRQHISGGWVHKRSRWESEQFPSYISCASRASLQSLPRTAWMAPLCWDPSQHAEDAGVSS